MLLDWLIHVLRMSMHTVWLIFCLFYIHTVWSGLTIMFDWLILCLLYTYCVIASVFSLFSCSSWCIWPLVLLHSVWAWFNFHLAWVKSSCSFKFSSETSQIWFFFSNFKKKLNKHGCPHITKMTPPPSLVDPLNDYVPPPIDCQRKLKKYNRPRITGYRKAELSHSLCRPCISSFSDRSLLYNFWK